MKAPSKPSAGSLAILIGKPAGGKLPAAAEEESDLELAAGDFIKAIKAGNAATVAETFRAMKQLCEAEYEDEE